MLFKCLCKTNFKHLILSIRYEEQIQSTVSKLSTATVHIQIEEEKLDEQNSNAFKKKVLSVFCTVQEGR